LAAAVRLLLNVSASAVFPPSRRAGSCERLEEGWTMAGLKWEISGDDMGSCHCDDLRRCIYTNPQRAVTHDHCTALMAYRINDGHFGESGPSTFD
jgi:hypothetical protein